MGARIRIAIVVAGIIETIVEAETLAEVQGYRPDAVCRLAAALDVAARSPHFIVEVAMFLDRFTAAEQKALANAANADVRALLMRLQTMETVDLAWNQLQAGLDLFVAQGLLTQARRDNIGNW